LKTYSLLRRITIGLTVTMLIAGLSAFAWLYLKTKWTDMTLREQTLFDQAQVIASYLKSGGNDSITLNLPPPLAEAYSGPESEYHYAVRDGNGQFLFDSGLAVSALPVFSRSRRKLYDYDPDGPGPLRVFGAALQMEVGQRTVFIQVEQKTHDPDYLRMAVVDEFITDGGWLEIPFLLVLLGVSIWIVKRALAPITRISALAGTIGPTNANIRLSVDQVPLEILPLVQSMNAVLDRLEQGLARQREFNANAAHQLRTPLSVLMANVDTLKETDIASRLRTDVEQMSRIVSQLLLVARLETVSIDLDEIVDLNEATAEIAGGLAPLALASGKSIELVRSDKPVVIRINTFAVRAALGNLIENAIKHTPAGTSVRLHVTDRPSIEVMDCGLGVPFEQRTKVFERFWRGDRGGDGAGLGLAIVDQIMKALQGSVSVGDAAGGGALFTLIFSQAAVVFKPIQTRPLAAE
jgi:signal transduction histidine kinase